ncbi:MAG: hypothetical protein U9R79_12960 [Armatimonadota bacterium]|nr:hypothetical protein [Armatimonadota bacterium]
MSGTEQAPNSGTEAPHEPSPTRRAGLLVGLALLVAAAVGVVVYEAKVYFFTPPEEVTGLAGGAALPDDFGSEDAKLKIEVCVGPCIAFVAAGIADAVDEWPERVRVEFYDYMSQEGQEFVADHGEPLACIFFNGENRFTIEDNGGERTVHLSGPPDGEYTMQDLAAILEQSWRDVYGDCPPGFDEKLDALAHCDPSSQSAPQEDTGDHQEG